MKSAINKSTGFTDSEKLLAELCDRTFLRLWSYPNVFKGDAKELCDLIAVFNNHVFLFSVRESRKFDDPNKDVELQWERWKKEAIDKQIATLEGAERYIRATPDKLFLDQACTIPFPLSIPKKDVVTHKIIVALGAKEACKSFSPNNVYGSLALGYGGTGKIKFDQPFLVKLDNADPVHILDSHNLDIILGELDTVYDFMTYLSIKEDAIKKHPALFYCGEEDLLAHYFMNYNPSTERYSISNDALGTKAIFVVEGKWYGFIQTDAYKRRKEANKVSAFWDTLLQYICDNALNGSLIGNTNVFVGQSAIYEMAKEPRFSRRSLSAYMIEMIENFPGDGTKIFRHIAFMPSFYPDRGYLFLQLNVPKEKRNVGDQEKKQKMLEIACGVAKNRFKHFKKIIGIAIDAPKFYDDNSEHFLLLECEEWTKEQEDLFNEENKPFNFFNTQSKKTNVRTMNDFPQNDRPWMNRSVARNEPCPCGSNKKYKRCCGLQS